MQRKKLVNDVADREWSGGGGGGWPQTWKLGRGRRNG